jgi:hypothetical protein
MGKALILENELFSLQYIIEEFLELSFFILKITKSSFNWFNAVLRLSIFWTLYNVLVQPLKN